MDCYHFYKQYEDYFKTSVAIRINYTPFAVLFFHDIISLMNSVQALLPKRHFNHIVKIQNFYLK